FGTYDGLVRFGDGKFSACTTKEGLFDDLVFGIAEDNHGDLWISCNKGVSRVKKKELDDFFQGRTQAITSVAYTMSDGLKSNEFNGAVQPTSLKARDGKLWFATYKGVAVIDPDKIRLNALPPPVFVEQVVVDKQPIDLAHKAQLPPGNGEIEFSYTALSLLAPEKVSFRYKLEGFDKEWIDAGTRRVAFYTNLPPGEYRFRVTACNNDGVWNETGASFDFYLKPHFHQTWWFYALCASAVALLGVGLYRVRVRQLKAHERELALRVDERTTELQLEIAERKRIEQDAQRRAAQATFIYEVGQRVSRELRQEALIPEIVTAVRDTFGYYNVMLLLLDEETNSLTLRAISGGYSDTNPPGMFFVPGEGVIGHAAVSGETVVSGDLTRDPHF